MAEVLVTFLLILLGYLLAVWVLNRYDQEERERRERKDLP